MIQKDFVLDVPVVLILIAPYFICTLSHVILTTTLHCHMGAVSLLILQMMKRRHHKV